MNFVVHVSYVETIPNIKVLLWYAVVEKTSKFSGCIRVTIMSANVNDIHRQPGLMQEGCWPGQGNQSLLSLNSPYESDKKLIHGCSLY